MSELTPRPSVQTETVKALRDAARGLLDDEDRRADSLNARGTALTGFLGVILSLAAAAGAALGGRITEDGLNHRAQLVVAVLVASALVSLVVAVGLVVWKVIRPLPGKTIGLDDTDRWIEADFTDLQPVMVDGYLTDGYTQALRAERNRNDGKAKWLTCAYMIMCAGLALVAAAGATATLGRYVGEGHQNTNTQTNGGAKAVDTPDSRPASPRRGEGSFGQSAPTSTGGSHQRRPPRNP